MSRLSSFAPCLLGFSVALLAHSRAHAQELLLDLPGAVPGAQAWGISIGDWDGDGVADLAIGYPFDDAVAPNAGSVSILSGKDTSVLATFASASADENFGSLMASVPDLDGDGLDDIAVAAPGASFTGPRTGSLYLFSGRTGTPIRRIDGAATHSQFGSPFGPIGDVDGDGICDLFAAEAYGYADVVHVVSGADGHEIVTLNGAPGDLFGWAVSALDDLDGDGVRDLLVCAPYYHDVNRNSVGAVYVMSTATGNTLRRVVGTDNVRWIGAGASGLGDLDGDGVRDYALFSNHLASGESRLLVYSAATKALLATLVGPWKDHHLGISVIDAGDVNGDGVSDLAIEGFSTDRSLVFLFSGKTFLPLDRIELGQELVYFFTSATPPLDLDGDGLADVIVNTLDPPNRDGRVRVFSGDELWQDAIPSDPAAGETLELATREGVPGALTLLALEDVDGTPTFQVVGVLATFDASGGRSLSFKIPTGLGAHDFTLRAYADDGAGKLIQSAPQLVSTQ